MSLASRINDGFAAVRNKLNLMVPRLLPAGGSAGQVLTKSSAADYAAGWAGGRSLPLLPIQPFTFSRNDWMVT